MPDVKHLAQLVLLSASSLGGLAVLIGAFGAHALAPILTAYDRAPTFTTANHYHFFHSLALLATGILMKDSSLNSTWLLGAAWGFGLGILFFSGSLYFLALSNWQWLGMIAPIGGLAFVAAWAALAAAVLLTR